MWRETAPWRETARGSHIDPHRTSTTAVEPSEAVVGAEVGAATATISPHAFKSGMKFEFGGAVFTASVAFVAMLFLLKDDIILLTIFILVAIAFVAAKKGIVFLKAKDAAHKVSMERENALISKNTELKHLTEKLQSTISGWEAYSAMLKEQCEAADAAAGAKDAELGAKMHKTEESLNELRVTYSTEVAAKKAVEEAAAKDAEDALAREMILNSKNAESEKAMAELGAKVEKIEESLSELPLTYSTEVAAKKAVEEAAAKDAEDAWAREMVLNLKNAELEKTIAELGAKVEKTEESLNELRMTHSAEVAARKAVEEAAAKNTEDARACETILNSKNAESEKTIAELGAKLKKTEESLNELRVACVPFWASSTAFSGKQFKDPATDVVRRVGYVDGTYSLHPSAGAPDPTRVQAALR